MTKETVKIRQTKLKEAILEQLRRFPLVQVACEKAGISRATFYRLVNKDEEFKAAVKGSIVKGIEFIGNMSKDQLASLIKDKNWPGN